MAPLRFANTRCEKFTPLTVTSLLPYPNCTEYMLLCVCVCLCVYICVYVCLARLRFSTLQASVQFALFSSRLKDIPIHFYFFYIYLLQSRIRAVVILQRNYRLIGPFRIPKFMTCDSFLLVLLFKGVFISSAIHWIVIFLV